MRIEEAAPLAITHAATQANERDWILDGLRRNRFRRRETARFLGISRKTPTGCPSAPRRRTTR